MKPFFLTNTKTFIEKVQRGMKTNLLEECTSLTYKYQDEYRELL